MTLLLSKNVDVFDGVTQFSAHRAVIELYDDHFVLARFDRATESKGETIFDVPLAELKVTGSSSMLVFIVGGERKRVDLSLGGRVVSGLGIAGLIAANSVIKGSGILEWVSALRARGVQTRYVSYARVAGWTIGVTLLIAAIGTVLSVVLRQ